MLEDVTSYAPDHILEDVTSYGPVHILEDEIFSRQTQDATDYEVPICTAPEPPPRNMVRSERRPAPLPPLYYMPLHMPLHGDL
jgi:hypothetical protein